MRTFNQKYVSLIVYVHTYHKVICFRIKEANEIKCSQDSYLDFYTSENIYIFRCILIK